MTTIHLVRHASHADVGRVLTGRLAGRPLTSAGRDEAAALAVHLKSVPLRAVLTSPRERTMETAMAIAAAAGVSPQVDERLDEIDFGAWAGRSFVDLQGDLDWEAWNVRRGSARPPGGESMSEAQARIVTAVEEVAARWPDGTVVMVSHADMIKAAVAAAIGLPLDLIHRFEINPASVSVIEAGPHGLRLLSLNGRPAEITAAVFDQPHSSVPA